MKDWKLWFRGILVVSMICTIISVLFQTGIISTEKEVLSSIALGISLYLQWVLYYLGTMRIDYRASSDRVFLSSGSNRVTPIHKKKSEVKEETTEDIDSCF